METFLFGSLAQQFFVMTSNASHEIHGEVAPVVRHDVMTEKSAEIVDDERFQCVVVDVATYI